MTATAVNVGIPLARLTTTRQRPRFDPISAMAWTCGLTTAAFLGVRAVADQPRLSAPFQRAVYVVLLNANIHHTSVLKNHI